MSHQHDVELMKELATCPDEDIPTGDLKNSAKKDNNKMSQEYNEESEDEIDVNSLLNYRRTKSYPEDLLRESMRRDSSKNMLIEPENYFQKPHIHDKRLKSCGQFQSALVTLSIKDGDVIQLWRLLGRKDVDISHIDGLGMQPIHYACLYGELDILKVLLQHHADVNSPTQQGEYALDLAVRAGNFEVAQYLVNKGAKVTTIINGIREERFKTKQKRPYSYTGSCSFEV